MVELNDIILADDVFYKVVYIDIVKNTMDLKCYNVPTITRGVPISNLREVENVSILKELPKNITFLRCEKLT